MTFNSTELEHYFSDIFQQKFFFSISEHIQPSISILSEKEKSIYHQFNSKKRQREWLRGRECLKMCINKIHNSQNPLSKTETSQLSFPHTYFSISHASERAVAVTVQPHEKSIGLGVDFEARIPKNGTEKFFLNTDEIETLSHLDFNEKQLRPIWSIKESIFKSNPNNKGQTLKNFTVNWSEYFTNPTGVHTLLTKTKKYKFSCLELQKDLQLALSISYKR